MRPYQDNTTETNMIFYKVRTNYTGIIYDTTWPIVILLISQEMLGTSRGFTAEHASKAVSGPILSPNEPNRTAELAPRHSGGDLPAKRALRNPIVDDREPCRDVEPTLFDHRSSRISTTRLRRHSDDGQQNNGQANGRSQVVGDEISSALSIGSSSVGLLVPERIVSPVGPINAVRSTRSERHKRTPCDEC